MSLFAQRSTATAAPNSNTNATDCDLSASSTSSFTGREGLEGGNSPNTNTLWPYDTDADSDDQAHHHLSSSSQGGIRVDRLDLGSSLTDPGFGSGSSGIAGITATLSSWLPAWSSRSDTRHPHQPAPPPSTPISPPSTSWFDLMVRPIDDAGRQPSSSSASASSSSHHSPTSRYDPGSSSTYPTESSGVDYSARPSPEDILSSPLAPPVLHVRPHSVHVHPQSSTSFSPAGGGPGGNGGGIGGDGDGGGLGDVPEEHEYEALPLGAGWGVNMAAGAMAGISEHSVIFPIDSIKTRMQILPSMTSSILASVTSSSSSGKLSTSSASSSTTTPRPALPHRPHHTTLPQVTTLSQHLRLMSTFDGVKSLWRGVASVIMGAGPAHAAHFGMYEFVREISGGRGEGWWGVGGTALAGAAATISSDALMNPFDVIKQRMQLHNSPYRSVLHCAKSVYTREGLAAFYVSYPTTLTMSVPFTAVQFSVYESLKGVLNPDGTYSPLTHVTAGGIAGGVAAAVTTPLDVAKTLLQTRGSSSDTQIRQAKGMMEALRLIFARDGWRGLRRGWVPRVLTVAPSTAISWMSYEFFKVLIRQKGTLPEKGQHV